MHVANTFDLSASDRLFYAPATSVATGLHELVTSVCTSDKLNFAYH
jgi:hypothetical protein